METMLIFDPEQPYAIVVAPQSVDEIILDVLPDGDSWRWQAITKRAFWYAMLMQPDRLPLLLEAIQRRYPSESVRSWTSDAGAIRAIGRLVRRNQQHPAVIAAVHTIVQTLTTIRDTSLRSVLMDEFLDGLGCTLVDLHQWLQSVKPDANIGAQP